ncbi:PRD domain-containing protein [Streptomyces qinzhouensis]|uniref:PRD domain-containing protein n=1 Tax=Streptomyces qinzhouensis TaxID=2599401 RepID=A0A5B8J992_9ACTN|nr:PRD domain-containing protein [Streptomyces qinzhouensis]QDY78385.1 PRD domain-containing protein [Streptomyces qinzhouensis]
MDDELARRIALFRQDGRVRPEVADFVSAELGALAAEGRTVTEATAGLLTSHLMLALTRLVDSVPITGFPADPAIAAELAAHPEAVDRARSLAGRARRELGAELPESEIGFLGLHLAALATATAEEQPPAAKEQQES